MKRSDSVFKDKKSERLYEEHCWTRNPKKLESLLKATKRETAQRKAEKALRQQTEMFWLLQLQFLSMDKDSSFTFDIFNGVLCSSVYKRNKFSRKMDKMLYSRNWCTSWTDEEFECLCTHFALQLAGVEE